ncbi:MAG: PQQ-binding-like beta-propeller repeat protein [Bryobacteraceae bacterium]|nr:PQQ-binding-like beta-propeller repeat protein [Bryobacteraceae bacterium]
MRLFLPLLLVCLPALQAATLDGAKVYADHCASCHASPAGRIPSRETMARLTPRRIVNSLESGIMFMPGRRMTPEERRSVAEFLTGKSYGIQQAQSTAGRCAAASPAPAGRLTAANLPSLKLRWAFGFEGEVMAFAQPTVSGNRLYVGSASGSVYALDAATGCTHWQFEAEAAVRTAIVVQGDRLWFGDLHSNVYSVDSGSGEMRWKKKLDAHPSARITAAPALHEGRLYVPVSSFEEGMASMPSYSCCTFRGSLVALDATSGRQIWQRFTIDKPAAVRGKNKQGAAQRGPSGVAIWSTPTVDPKRGLVYVTTGDNYSDPGTPLSDAILAIRLNNGSIAWAKQVLANDRWNAACLGDKVNCPEDNGPDADFGSSALLTRTPSGRELLIAAQKSGIVWALDPDKRGEIVWSTPAGKGGPLGGIQWGHALDATQVYAPISDVQLPDMANTGGGLVALNLETGKVAWKAPPAACGTRAPCSPAQMAAAAVIPGAVISGARDGIYRAYAAGDGSILWSFDTWRDFETVNNVAARGGSIDGPGPTIAGNMMYVNSGYSLWNGRGGNVLLAFSAD